MLIRWLLAATLALAAPAAFGRDAILLFGNSLTFWYDVPAQLQRMLGDGTRVVAALRGGAHVVDYVDDGTFAKLLDAYRPRAVVLQDFGGELYCFDARGRPAGASCAHVIASYEAIVVAAKRGGARVVILGTHQRDDGAARNLQRRERWLAKHLGAAWIDINTWQRRLTAAVPDAQWFGADGGHPGVDANYVAAKLLCLELGATRCSLEPFEARQMRVARFSLEGGSVLEPVEGSVPVVARTRAIDSVWCSAGRRPDVADGVSGCAEAP